MSEKNLNERNLNALNRVLKTLTAVRTTLNDEEQAILDQLILQSEPDDVTLHNLVSNSLSIQSLRSNILVNENGVYQVIVM